MSAEKLKSLLNFMETWTCIGLSMSGTSEFVKVALLFTKFRKGQWILGGM